MGWIIDRVAGNFCARIEHEVERKDYLYTHIVEVHRFKSRIYLIPSISVFFHHKLLVDYTVQMDLCFLFFRIDYEIHRQFLFGG